ncbi:flavin monooxygenase-like protein [Lobosporangium transversale]|uniref:Flavin-containing monooxygenase 1 n=1 Tax=Lobosporangium transversale TaxID=64571 RepID=A0A1Y2GF55_9FUNG|nr:flavin monooxygenase-like protein [Lobosporangium transversale]ORZ07268.1 flavin monooxygenase-like protein [Lobosporangium transversale]|eukprot:XP_021877931.1 flavin monooxygenase-like protein [Lobosporangium transversale]
MAALTKPTDTKPRKRVAVIGGGCAGLTSIKQCLDEKDRLEVVAFEQEPYTGGLWRYVDVTEENPNPHSSVYKSITINVSKEMMTFSDFAIPGSWPTYLHHRKIVQYFDMYAERYKLKDHIRFSTKVVEVQELKDEGNRWLVRFHPVTTTATTSADFVVQEEIFDYVMMCTGHHSVPRYPSFPGMDPDDLDAFTGQQIHSHFYREPNQFKEQNVLVVGLGNSGADLAVELSQGQSPVYLSRRTPVWILPRWLLGKPMDHFITRFIYMLPAILVQWTLMSLIKLTFPKLHPLMKPKHRVFMTNTVISASLHERTNTGMVVPKVNIKRIGPGKRVEFEDGSSLEDIDTIMWCTGYQVSYPTLDPEILSSSSGGNGDNQAQLWKFMFSPRHPNIAFIGLIRPKGAFAPVLEMQSRFVCQVWADRSLTPIPSPDQMEEEIVKEQRETQKEWGANHMIQFDSYPYMDKLAKRIGCYPSYSKLVRRFGLVEGTRLKIEAIFGPPFPMFYRLVGPHPWMAVGDGKALPGDPAREVIWGYRGCKEYQGSKYLRDESESLLKT